MMNEQPAGALSAFTAFILALKLAKGPNFGIVVHQVLDHVRNGTQMTKRSDWNRNNNKLCHVFQPETMNRPVSQT
jgi:hypothetical protein